MENPETDPGHAPKQAPTREYVNYIVGGLIAWGLIGWGLDLLLDTRWIVFLGALLGATAGLFLARHHLRHRRRGFPRSDEIDH
ncbi:hypothetical protein ACIPVK_14850 [Paeniglutamicibacter sp. MACA_103]|uniref:hypothetical protein n=1 Tax=Paeniglutamicibacter sp. MACA_103 TaxID=3377337 RepID=UPI003894D675